MKDIKGYERLYAIEEDGRVWSYLSNKYLKHIDSSRGYYIVTLVKDKVKKYYKIHRLIAETYIPNPDNKPFIDHINRDRKDNRIDNLRWATQSENNQNKTVHKTNKLNEQYISYDTTLKYYLFSITRNGIKHYKRFKTIDDAISYKNEYLMRG